MKPRTEAVLLVVAGALLVAACGSSAPPPGQNQPFPTTRPTAAAASAVASAIASAQALTFSPEDFTTSDRNRDPFRSYVEIFISDSPSGPGKEHRVQVSADRFSLDELKLVAIVSGTNTPRAMFVDTEGKGWIVTLGQLIGRSELVKAGGSGGAEYDLNWRVDRIREGDVVFVRENPGRANIPTATRVIALRPEGDQARVR
jgi:type IV pilus assembly protein PilP